MSTTAEINAYLNWRAEREGKTVDVSPEAYALHMAIFDLHSAVRDVIVELDLNDDWQRLVATTLNEHLHAVDDALDANGGM